ncbi:MAG: hypothetical protein WCJ33_05885 [Pseudomonadota bacterium]
MKRQLAIEYLIEQLTKKQYSDTIPIIIEKSKEMERQQIINAFNQSWYDRNNSITPEQYYQENYFN